MREGAAVGRRKKGKASPKPQFGTGRAGKEETEVSKGSFADDHTRWGTIMEEDAVLRDVWIKRILDAAEAITIQNDSRNRGTLPAFAKRIINKLRNPQIDWRTILNDFVQEEINDYSFSPPDRRFDESPFFLPDFNEKDEHVRNILFMIDTSGSMSYEAITAAFSEIVGAVAQFGGKLAGKLGFFDAALIEPIPFEDVNELKRIEAAGGGGTDFQIIFEYVARYMEEEPPASIIILTDGYAPFPEERLANSIPVLWLLIMKMLSPHGGKSPVYVCHSDSPNTRRQ
jgi:predicted metal-dependent peptidase